jgi:D-inositol-3-phosphate glycosyltransferase
LSAPPIPPSPRRVLLVCHYYAPHIGGIESVVQAEAERLTALGHEVTVLTSADRSSTRVEGGVRVVRVAAWNGLEHRAGVPFPLFSPRLLAQAIRLTRRTDIVHVHDCFYLSSWCAGIAALLFRKPLVLSQHVAMVQHPSALVSAAQKTVYGTIGRLLLRRARKVFVINEYVGRFVAGLGAQRHKTVVLSNGVDAEFYRPAADPAERELLRKEYGLPLDRPLALFVGRLVPKKGIDIALAARTSEFDLVVVGSGDAAMLDGVPGVHHLGSRPPRHVAEIFRACDLFVLPTTGEIFPLVVKEAMSSALPVVTTDEPDYAALGVDRLGMALVSRDAAAVGAAVRRIVGDERAAARMGEYSRSYARAQFSWDEHLDLLRANYRAALERSP